MPLASFKTNPIHLIELLKECASGAIQLPDFQRSWVWDEDRIKSLIASVSRAFPVGALMMLESGPDVVFKPRPLEGAPDTAKKSSPKALLLDGQQRMTSLYQVTLRGRVVQTETVKKKKVKRWFYIDIEKALDKDVDRDDAIVGVPEEKIIKPEFGRPGLDLSTPAKEYELMMFPVGQVFDWDDWQDGFNDFWKDEGKRTIFRNFKKEVLESFKSYQVPVISLDSSTSKEAVCVVFEKVNTGGKPLDAFELVTAMYAAEGHELRKDWYGAGGNDVGRHGRFARASKLADAEKGILAEVANTDFLHVISLFHTRDKRRRAEAQGREGRDLPQITGNRPALLNLPLEAYREYEAKAERGFLTAAKFLHMLHIYRIFDLPYQSQIIPLAAILAEIGDAWEHETTRAKLTQWYWNGVFGELYGSAVDTRIAKDFVEVPAWINGGTPPSTVSETIFRADRLKTMRMRLSAAYKGVNALLMKEGAQDFRSGQAFDHTVFFGENVDIHHIFPQDWCRTAGKKPEVFDSIINKTPLSYRTNRKIGGHAPSIYLAALERGGDNAPAIPRQRLDQYLRTHLIDPNMLWADRFEDFMADRQTRLLTLIEKAMGKKAYGGSSAEGDEDERDPDASEAAMTIAA